MGSSHSLPRLVYKVIGFACSTPKQRLSKKHLVEGERLTNFDPVKYRQTSC